MATCEEKNELASRHEYAYRCSPGISYETLSETVSPLPMWEFNDVKSYNEVTRRLPMFRSIAILTSFHGQNDAGVLARRSGLLLSPQLYENVDLVPVMASYDGTPGILTCNFSLYHICVNEHWRNPGVTVTANARRDHWRVIAADFYSRSQCDTFMRHCPGVVLGKISEIGWCHTNPSKDLFCHVR